VHVTGGVESDFSSLYILVIAVSAVLMPLRSTLLISILAGVLYFTDIVLGHPIQQSIAVWLQIAVFFIVAVATGWLASRVRVLGEEREVLRQEVQRLQLEADDILHNISSGIITVDAEGQLLYANPAAEKLLEFEAGPFPVAGFLEGLKQRAPGLWSAVEGTLRSGERRFRSEGRVELPDRGFDIGVTTTALDTDPGHPPSVTAIFTDISNQKRMEEFRMRNERLEAVAALSASLAHEIRNPLASIRSSVEQLARSVRSGEDERFLAQLVVRESDRLTRILSEFLDFSRVRVSQHRPVDIAQVVQGAIAMVREHPDSKEDTVIEPHCEPALLDGDEDLLHRVVTNLTLNAIQAANGKVRIEIEARALKAGELPPGVQIERPVVLRVSDNGPGIPDDVRNRLFEPFVSGRAGGTGLGLAIVQRAVLAHRGIVLVDSIKGQGTTFTIFFPAHRAAEVAA